VILSLLENLFFAAIPAVGFGMLFNAPPRILGWCALGGAVGRGLRFLLVEAGLPLPASTLASAAVVSFLGVWAARRIQAHPKVFTVASIIPMVPGVPIYTSLLALSQIQREGLTYERMATALTHGLNATAVVAALAIGLAVPGLLVYRKRPVL
jgi:uncharacterized membrane protein YjjB (DUF3815 family)